MSRVVRRPPRIKKRDSIILPQGQTGHNRFLQVKNDPKTDPNKSLKRHRAYHGENWVGDYSTTTRPNQPSPRPTRHTTTKTAPTGSRSLPLGRPTGVGGRTDDHPCGLHLFSSSIFPVAIKIKRSSLCFYRLIYEVFCFYNSCNVANIANV